MARRSQPADPKDLARTLEVLVKQLHARLENPEIGERVAHLVAIHRVLRDLGAGLAVGLSAEPSTSGRARVLAYLRLQVGRIVHTEELMIVAGIGDYARRIRELRTQEGWPIISGAAMRDVSKDLVRRGRSAEAPPQMVVEEYILVEDARDEDAIARWRRAGVLRGQRRPILARITDYLEAAAGRRVTAEELRYVAHDESDWIDALAALADRGCQILGYAVPDPSLPYGIYVLPVR